MGKYVGVGGPNKKKYRILDGKQMQWGIEDKKRLERRRRTCKLTKIASTVETCLERMPPYLLGASDSPLEQGNPSFP